MEERNLGRRGFLGLFTGAIAAAVAAPIIKPKSFFSFFVPPAPPPVTAVTLGIGETIAQAIARLSPLGGTVFVPPGALIVNETILLTKDVVISGANLAMTGCYVQAMEPREKPMFTLTGGNNVITECMLMGDGPGAAFMIEDPKDGQLLAMMGSAIQHRG